jgi:small subunit ribosomal protein S21
VYYKRQHYFIDNGTHKRYPIKNFDNFNVEVKIYSGDDVGKAIKKFCKKVKENGILEEVKRRRFYEKPSVRRRRKEKEERYRAERDRKERESASLN